MASKILPVALLGAAALLLTKGGSKSKKSGGGSPYGPDELLVADEQCNQILHQSDRFFDEQTKLVIMSALEGRVSGADAEDINAAMMDRYIPHCLALGKDGVGPGVREWWAVNTSHIRSQFTNYTNAPQLLEEDAKKFGVS